MLISVCVQALVGACKRVGLLAPCFNTANRRIGPCMYLGFKSCGNSSPSVETSTGVRMRRCGVRRRNVIGRTLFAGRSAGCCVR